MTTRYPTNVYMGRSTKPNRKYMVIVGNKNIHFGTPRQLDFTKTHDKHDQRAYIHAHPGLDDITNVKLWYSPTFWERWILWNKPSKRESIRYLERKLHIHILPFNLQNTPVGVLHGGVSKKTAIVATATLGAAAALALAHKQYKKNKADAEAATAEPVQTAARAGASTTDLSAWILQKEKELAESIAKQRKDTKAAELRAIIKIAASQAAAKAQEQAAKARQQAAAEDAAAKLQTAQTTQLEADKKAKLEENEKERQRAEAEAKKQKEVAEKEAQIAAAIALTAQNEARERTRADVEAALFAKDEEKRKAFEANAARVAAEASRVAPATAKKKKKKERVAERVEEAEAAMVASRKAAVVASRKAEKLQKAEEAVIAAQVTLAHQQAINNNENDIKTAQKSLDDANSKLKKLKQLADIELEALYKTII